MSKINNRLKEYANIIIGSAINSPSETKHNVPTIFDGSIELYINWLKYLRRLADEHCIELIISLNGTIKAKRNF